MSTARRSLFFVLAMVASFSAFAPVAALASGPLHRATVSAAAALAPRSVRATPNDADADDVPESTTTIVESAGPVAKPGDRSPEIGPIVVPTDGSSFSGAWWLVAFGGVQIIGLVLITRRARSRLATRDAQP